MRWPHMSCGGGTEPFAACGESVSGWGWKWGIGLNLQRLGTRELCGLGRPCDRFSMDDVYGFLSSSIWASYKRTGGWLLAAMASAGSLQSVRSFELNGIAAVVRNPVHSFVLMAQMASTLGWMVAENGHCANDIGTAFFAILSVVWLGQNWPS